ncbi:MAG: PilZ domain-containing protein [Candidatus Eremiobacterota bacterium]
MFGIFGPPVVEFVGSEGKTIQFLIKKPQAAGKVVAFRLEVPIPDKPGAVDKINVNARIVTCRPHDGAYLCVGETGLDEASLEEIRKRYQSAAKLRGAAGRRSRRYITSIRVLSPELPGYRALTVDFSMHGLQLESEGPVEVGKIVNITLELDASSSPQLNLDGKVVWCREKDRRKFLIGVELVNITEERQKILNFYDQYLAARDKGDIQQRQLADADLFLRGNRGDG